MSDTVRSIVGADALTLILCILQRTQAFSCRVKAVFSLVSSSGKAPRGRWLLGLPSVDTFWRFAPREMLFFFRRRLC